MVDAWRSYAFRVPKEKFERVLKPDPSLKSLCQIIEAKNFILNFQYALIDINKDKLSHLLQGVIDENKIVKIIPEDLDSFFKVCFILDNLNKISQNANLWLIYLLSYIHKGISLEDISKIVYCVDFLYSKIELKSNELTRLIGKVKELMKMVNGFHQTHLLQFDPDFAAFFAISPLLSMRHFFGSCKCSATDITGCLTLHLLQSIIRGGIEGGRHVHPKETVREVQLPADR